MSGTATPAQHQEAQPEYGSTGNSAIEFQQGPEGMHHAAEVFRGFCHRVGRGVSKVVEVVGIQEAPSYTSDHYNKHDGKPNPYKNGLRVTFVGKEHRG